MSLANLLVFAVAYLAVVGLPGPGVTAVVARTLAQGTRGSPAFIAGCIAGALFWFTLAAAGLAALAATFGALFVAVRYAGAAYLLYLAWKLWTGPARPMGAGEPTPEDGWRLFGAGLAVNLGNPKSMVFFLALLPTVVDLRLLTVAGFVELAVTVVLVVGCVFAAYTVAAARARSVFTSPRASMRIKRGSAVATAAAAVTVAAR